MTSSFNPSSRRGIPFFTMCATAPWILLSPTQTTANPLGMTVQSGTASAVTTGNQLTVHAGNNAFLQWQSFNIGAGEVTHFVQPSESSIVWNSIQDKNPSHIWGNLEANGVVVLMNSAGFYFGPNSMVSAAGLVVSTAPAVPAESGSGLFWQFQGAPPSASIVNFGRIQVGKGGSAFLIAEQIQNNGDIVAPEGSIGLLSGRDVLISERPDGRGLSAHVNLPAGTVDNNGRLLADAGSIALHARVVNQEGQVRANTVRERNGIIELVASDSVALGANSSISASGEAGSIGSGGTIRIKSEGSFRDQAGSELRVSGGGAGGNGGIVEISAPRMSAIHSLVNAEAKAGSLGGSLFIDPQNIVIDLSGSDSAGSGTVGAEDPPDVLHLNASTAFVGFSQIHLQATRNISVAAGTIWDLVASTGIQAPGSLLWLEAGNNISIENGAAIVGGENWSLRLQAGRDFSTADQVTAGIGNISLSGTGYLQSHNGSIDLLAGSGISVAGGAVRTLGGGSISATAVAGSVTTGTKANGFLFRPTGYDVDPQLGGISTAKGGDVTISAGQDIISYLPLAGGTQTDGGSGAFGAEPGNVSLTAGRDISGHYVVRNGKGSIQAGRNAGTASRLLALSLVRGGWDVHAGQDILLQEVRNPNGIFNNLGSTTSPNRHLFDYAPDAYTTLEAGNSVQLRGTALPRYTDVFSQGMTPIYPGAMKIKAGAGAVILGNDVTLFPSPTGNLEVTTTDGGSVQGTKPGDLAQWILSDSGKVRYRQFGDFGISDHASSPVHLNDTIPVKFDISGNFNGILLGVPKRAEIHVKGDMINSRFEGQNLQAGDVTRIEVEGDIYNRSEFTSVPLDEAPDFSVFDWVYPPLSGGLVGLRNSLFYDPATRQLTFQGRMTGEQLQALLSLPVQILDNNGSPVLAPNGEPLTHAVQVLSPEVANKLYADSQNIPLNPDTGYRIGGGGRFEMSARNLDLGATAGIVSLGPRANPALAQIFLEGADIDVRTEENLSMFSTTISSLNGGSININAGGSIDVGSAQFRRDDQTARGIFTVDDSDVTVIARGDINVNGSRIAAYGGGNVFVRSEEGDVNAGTGGTGAVTVEKIIVDPQTRQILSYSPTIPGSGILATTFPRSLDPAFPTSDNPVGDIRVETPKGDILASAGGVVQIPLNGVGDSAGTVTLIAGTKDEAGNVVHVGNIDASGSGVIGGTVKLEATGDIKGLVFARQDIDLTAQQSVNVTALAQGGVDVSAGGNVSGTIIGVGSVNASGGGTVDATLLSQNVTTSGDVSSSQVGFGQGTAANSTSQSVSTDDTTKTTGEGDSEDDEEKKRARQASAPKLVRTVGRVTVILPQ